MNEATPGTPEHYARTMCEHEGITPTDEEVELLAEDIEACAIDEYEEESLGVIVRGLYKRIGKGNLKSYLACLKVSDEKRQAELRAKAAQLSQKSR